jgi:hypothetical protein
MPGGDRRSRNLHHLGCKDKLIQSGVHVLDHARLPMESSKWRRSWRSMAPSSNITTKVIADNRTTRMIDSSLSSINKEASITRFDHLVVIGYLKFLLLALLFCFKASGF